MRVTPGRLAEGLLEWSGQTDPSTDVEASAWTVAQMIILVTGALSKRKH